jgi:hypothetical protein
MVLRQWPRGYVVRGLTALVGEFSVGNIENVSSQEWKEKEERQWQLQLRAK